MITVYIADAKTGWRVDHHDGDNAEDCAEWAVDNYGDRPDLFVWSFTPPPLYGVTA